MDYVTGESLQFDQSMLDEFEAVKIPGSTRAQLRALVGTRDDVIDPDAQRQFYRQQGIECHDVNWGHRVESIPVLVERIHQVLQPRAPQ